MTKPRTRLISTPPNKYPPMKALTVAPAISMRPSVTLACRFSSLRTTAWTPAQPLATADDPTRITPTSKSPVLTPRKEKPVRYTRHATPRTATRETQAKNRPRSTPRHITEPFVESSRLVTPSATRFVVAAANIKFNGPNSDWASLTPPISGDLDTAPKISNGRAVSNCPTQKSSNCQPAAVAYRR